MEKRRRRGGREGEPEKRGKKKSKRWGKGWCVWRGSRGREEDEMEMGV